MLDLVDLIVQRMDLILRFHLLHSYAFLNMEVLLAHLFYLLVEQSNLFFVLVVLAIGLFHNLIFLQNGTFRCRVLLLVDKGSHFFDFLDSLSGSFKPFRIRVPLYVQITRTERDLDLLQLNRCQALLFISQVCLLSNYLLLLRVQSLCIRGIFFIFEIGGGFEIEAVHR